MPVAFFPTFLLAVILYKKVSWRLAFNTACCSCWWKRYRVWRFGFSFAVICRNMLRDLQAGAHTKASTRTRTHRLQVYPTHTQIVVLSSIVTVCVTDLISPTICWLEAQRRRSYPAWQIQTASVYACFSQGLAQYGWVESLSWPPNLHPYTLSSKDLDML